MYYLMLKAKTSFDRCSAHLKYLDIIDKKILSFSSNKSKDNFYGPNADKISLDYMINKDKYIEDLEE